MTAPPVSRGPSGPHSDNEECSKRRAVDASIATAEEGAGKQLAKISPALLAQMSAIEKRISELAPIQEGTCPESLAIAALSGRLERAREPIRRAVANERRREEIERRRQEVNAKPWPERVKLAVLENRIEIGMTSDQVTAAWGRAQSINETITATSRQEQWTYPGPTYLYFTNGTLTTVQRRR